MTQRAFEDFWRGWREECERSGLPVISRRKPTTRIVTERVPAARVQDESDHVVALGGAQ